MDKIFFLMPVDRFDWGLDRLAGAGVPRSSIGVEDEDTGFVEADFGGCPGLSVVGGRVRIVGGGDEGMVGG